MKWLGLMFPALQVGAVAARFDTTQATQISCAAVIDDMLLELAHQSALAGLRRVSCSIFFRRARSLVLVVKSCRNWR